jgi:biopolymer transport protein ExbD
MTWKIRHQGSPRSIEGLTRAEVMQGMLDGLWEPTDEVMGPDERDWTALESHPEFSELAQDIEPPQASEHEDETRLDMTALIDVTMVLLIFFILTMSAAALQKMIEGPSSSKDKPIPEQITITQVQVRDLMIVVHVEQVNPDDWRLKVEKEEVAPADLRAKLSDFVKETRRTELLIDCPDDAPRDLVIAILDAAKRAGVKPHDLRPFRGEKEKPK